MARLHSGWPQVPIIIANRWTYYLMGANEDDPAHKGQLIRFAGEATIQSQPEFLNEFRRSFLAGVCELSQRRTVYLIKGVALGS